MKTKMEISEILDQTSEYNKPLFKLVNKVVKELKAEGRQFCILNKSDTYFDIDTDGYNMEVAILDKKKKDRYLTAEEIREDDWNATGWEKSTLDPKFEKLLGEWKWENLMMEEGNILLFSKYMFPKKSAFIIVNKYNLVDDILTMWGEKDYIDELMNLNK